MLNRLIDLAVHRRIATMILTIAFLIFGVYTFSKLKIEAFPDVTNVQVMVISLYPGQAAEEIEKQVTIPIERALVGVPRVLMQRSITSFGLSQVILTFEDDVEIYFARQQVAERLSSAEVPDSVKPTLGPNDTPVGQIFQYTLESDTHSPSELRSWQDWVVSKHLMRAAGVADVVSFGGFQKEYHILADPAKLRSSGLALKDVISAVSESNGATSGGYIAHGESEFVVRGRGYLKTIHDIENIVIRAQGGTPILVRNIAKVNEGYTPRRGAVARNDDIDSIEGTILLRRGENPKDVLKSVHETVERINKDILPKGMRIVPFYDRTGLVDTTLKTVSRNMLEGAALVTIVIWMFLRALSGSFAVAITMPLALLASFIGLYYAGVPANLLSMGAIDFGILLDGAVILVENAYRHIGEERPPPERVPHVVATAAKEVLRPTLFSMSIIGAAMMPIFTLERVEGRIFRPVALTYAFALAGALFFTLTTVPAITAILLQRSHAEEKDPYFLVVLRAYYLKALRAALRYPLVPPLAAVAVLVIAIALIPSLGTQFLPEMNEGDIHITVTMPAAVSLERGSQVLRDTRIQLLTFPEVKDVLSEQGHPEDGTDDEAPNQSEMFVIMKPESHWHTGRNKEQIVDAMRERLGVRPGVVYNFSQPIKDRVEESISGIRGQIVVKVYGEDLHLMHEKLEEVRRVLNSTRGARDVEIYRAGTAQHIVADIDREATARYGISVRDVEDAIESGFGGKVAAAMWEGERKVDVRVKLPTPSQGDTFSVGRLDIPVDKTRLPLSALARVHIDKGRTQINREQGGRFLAIKCNIEGRDMGSFVDEAQLRTDREVHLPEGYYMTWGGEFENQRRAMHRLSIIVPISVLLIFALLYMAFGATLPALVVLLDVPFATVGGIFALYLTHTVLSVSAAVGFITLFGVAVMDGVLLITYIRQARAKTPGSEEAIFHAVSQRLRPVLMTALLASLGLLPAALSHAIGSDTQRPFAIVIIGGLISSTILTLLVLPTLYELFERWFGTGRIARRLARLGGVTVRARRCVRWPLATLYRVFFVLLVAPSVTRAAQEGPPLSMADAVTTALQRNRDVLAARLDIETAQLDRLAASIYPNPTFSYTMSNIVLGEANLQYPPIPQPGAFGQLQHNLSLSEVVDVWAKRSARLRSAEIGITVKRLLVEDALREIVYQVRTAFLDVLRAQESRDLARETNDRYGETVRISRSRFAAGDISQNELRKIELESLRYQTAVIDSESELDLARQKLAGLLGLASADQLPATVAQAAGRTALDPPEVLIERAAQLRPDLRAAQQGRSAAAATLNSARRESLPDISVSILYQHSEFTASGDNPNSLGLGVSLPLPLFDRNQANIGRAHVEGRRAENAAERAWLIVQQDVHGATRRAARSQLLLDAFESGGMSERAESALRVAERAYKAGAASLLDLLEAQRTHLDTRAQYLRAQHEYRQSLVEVSHAVAGDMK